MNFVNMKTSVTGDNGPLTLSRNVRWFAKSRWGVVAVALFVLTMALSVQAGVDDVEIDQSPLIVSEPLPPNIVLMYDDSGSMGYNYLYDPLNTGNRTFQDALGNALYYDPRVEYNLPPKANGSLYPKPTFPKGFSDPFRSPGTEHTIVNQWRYSETQDDDRAFKYIHPVTKQVHYVAENCSEFGSNCTTDANVQQNVANWYSYYRDRDLAAKSGIFSAFSDISPSFRVGFGSINNRGSSYITDNFDTSRRFQKEGKWLAGVERFGKQSEVGSGVQREKFWGWLSDVRSSGSTPLRKSLKAVGEYYKDEKQPWESGYDDGSTYSSEIYSCRPSFTILLSDGEWNSSDPGVGNADNGEPKPFNGAGQSDYLADVALHYWKTDLRSTMKNDVPVTDRDEANWQHMSTFTVGLGVEPKLANDGGGSMADIFNWARTGSPGSIDTNAFNWGSNKIADFAHAAVNGRGDFFSARNPQQFADGLRQALAAIAATPGAGSSPSFSGGETLTSNTRQYTASYMTGSWTGELKAVGYDKVTDTFSVDPWRASSQLPEHDKRNIWTLDKSGTAVEFKQNKLGDYLSTLGDNLYPSDPKGEDWGKHIVNYLRGDRSYEDSSTSPLSVVLRKRDTLLGDIVASTPVVIGDPKADLYKHVLDKTYFDGLSGSEDYKKFATDKSGRTPMVYVAANDGMLHAFNANTGKEVFAFIPGALVGESGDGSLARLANPEYGVYSPVDGTQPVPHQFYNDGKLTTQNVYIDGEWKTILVGTTGRGRSRTVYALDITNPADLADPDKAENAILWERSAGDGESNDDWIGMALGRPTISLIKNSSGTEGKWVVHIGNGPNSNNKKAALLQFDLKTGALNVYTTDTTTGNGLAAPYVIQKDDSDGVSEYAFAGDLQGNVWRFDLSANGGSGTKLYIAKDSSGKRQPITADMYATKNEKTGAIWVFFGTGRFLARSDILQAAPQVQTWYGLRALTGSSGLDEVKDSHSRSNLQKREILAEEAVGSGIFRATSPGQFSDLTSDDDVGWYMDLISPEKGKEGERIVYQTQLIAGRLIVNTLIPKSNNPCDTSPAGATLIVDPFSGANPGEPVLDANDDGTTDNKDSITTDTGDRLFYNGQRYGVGMAGVFSALRGENGDARLFGLGLDSSQINLDTTIGATGAQRLNWHEIIN